MKDGMIFASAASTAWPVETAVSELFSQVSIELEGRSVDLALVFYSYHHEPQAQQIAALTNRLIIVSTLGCISG